jgi:hypothetical protein
VITHCNRQCKADYPNVKIKPALVANKSSRSVTLPAATSRFGQQEDTSPPLPLHPDPPPDVLCRAPPTRKGTTLLRLRSARGSRTPKSGSIGRKAAAVVLAAAALSGTAGVATAAAAPASITSQVAASTAAGSAAAGFARAQLGKL